MSKNKRPKPGMIVFCKDNKEAEQLLDCLEKLGYANRPEARKGCYYLTDTGHGYYVWWMKVYSGHCKVYSASDLDLSGKVMFRRPIGPGMIISCSTEEETRELLEYMEDIGYRWLDGYKPSEWAESTRFRCFHLQEAMRFTATDPSSANIRFSDLIGQEDIHLSVPFQYLPPDEMQLPPDNFLRWRKIFPGMIIECKNELETRTLLRHLERLGCRWKSGQRPTETKVAECFNTLRLYEDGTISYCPDSYANTRFMDLIEQQTADDCKTGEETSDLSEFSAKEVLEWLTTYQGTTTAKRCFGDSSDLKSIFEKYTAAEIVEKISAFEASKKEKSDFPKPEGAETEPSEVETGYHCMICKGICGTAIAEQYDLWNVSRIEAWASVTKKARALCAESGDEYSVKMWTIFRKRKDPARKKRTLCGSAGIWKRKAIRKNRTREL